MAGPSVMSTTDELIVEREQQRCRVEVVEGLCHQRSAIVTALDSLGIEVQVKPSATLRAPRLLAPQTTMA